MSTLLALAVIACLTAVPASAASSASSGGISATPAPAKKKATKKKAAKKKAASEKSDTADSPKTGGGIAAGDPATEQQAAEADQPTVAGSTAKFVKNVAYAPTDAPDAVKQAIWAANKIIGRPYVYGGGHASFKSNGYDCSGTVSYALHGGDLLDSPLDSGSFMSWGKSGRGEWITIFTNEGHAYMVIAGIRLDTSAADDPNGKSGPRWRPLRGSNAGFKVRHPAGL
jgi:cell wall-associated NlpC family hydrolase